MKHRLLKKKIKITHNNIISIISNQQTIIQNFKQKFELRFASFRFCFSDLFASTTFSEFVTTINEFVSITFYERTRTSISINSLQWHQKRMRSIFYIFAINIKKWIYYIQRYENKWKKKLKNIDSINLLHDQINSLFSQSFARRR